MSQPVAVKRGTWILEHVLAALTLGSFVYIYWLITKIDMEVPLEELQSQLELQLPPRIVLAGTLSCVAAIWFWFRMFKDFIRHRPARYAVAWGAFLLIAVHLAALVYFAVVWRPRKG